MTATFSFIPIGTSPPEIQVYDVTPFLGRHPGGDAMLRPAGGDATEGFYGPQHPAQAKEILDRYYIGMLKISP